MVLIQSELQGLLQKVLHRAFRNRLILCRLGPLCS